MADELSEFLAQIPEEDRVDEETREFFEKEIIRGAELNSLQYEIVIGLVSACVDKNILPPKPFDAFCAFAYAEWSMEAKTNDAVKPRLAQFVRLLKSNAEAATRVAQIAQNYVKNRQIRRDELNKFLQAASAHAGESSLSSKKAAKLTSNQYVYKMQSARHGNPENPLPNLDLAVIVAEEAVDEYPQSPLVLFEAAGCFQLLADRGTHLNVTDRYVHMRQAYTLFQQCLAVLTEPPYGKLKGEYDVWRKGLVKLIPRVQKKLKSLEDKQG